MNMQSSMRSEPRQAGADTVAHLFAIGQAVRLKTDFVQRFQKVDVYRVIGKLPPLGESPQYRIRSEGEPHDRIATQDRLEAVTPGAADGRPSLTASVFPKD